MSYIPVNSSEKPHTGTVFDLTYESQANITARLDCIQTMFVPDTSNRFRSWAEVWDHMYPRYDFLVVNVQNYWIDYFLCFITFVQQLT